MGCLIHPVRIGPLACSYRWPFMTSYTRTSSTILNVGPLNSFNTASVYSSTILIKQPVHVLSMFVSLEILVVLCFPARSHKPTKRAACVGKSLKAEGKPLLERELRVFSCFLGGMCSKHVYKGGLRLRILGSCVILCIIV